MEKGIFRKDVVGERIVKVGDRFGIELKYEDNTVDLLSKSFVSYYEAEQEINKWRQKPIFKK